MNEHEHRKQQAHEARNERAKAILVLTGRVATYLYDDVLSRRQIAQQLGIHPKRVRVIARYLGYPDGQAGKRGVL